MSADRPAGLVGVPVTTNGIELGRTVDVLVGTDGLPVGFELACRDGTRRFLAAGAADIHATEIRVVSALVFLSERELIWYRERTTAG
jgi:hypothetical protein